MFQCLEKAVWKGLLKVILAIIHGLEMTVTNTAPNGNNNARGGGVASAFHALEIAHTHFWLSETGHLATSATTSTFGIGDDISCTGATSINSGVS